MKYAYNDNHLTKDREHTGVLIHKGGNHRDNQGKLEQAGTSKDGGTKDDRKEVPS